MGSGRIIAIIFMFIFIAMLLLYWYFPSDPKEFNFNLNSNSNFSELENYSGMQFYENMRFPSEKISFKIDEECTLQKRAEMLEAFDIIENLTLLDFYSSYEEPEINVYCEDKVIIKDQMFIAGEGGPANVSLGEEFSVIQNGYILLIRDSSCERPNVAIHELLHVLGFEHSENPNNIMYPVSRCKQIIGEDMIERINELYSIPSLPDIALKKVSAELKGRFLNANITLQNEGLRISENFTIGIYANDKKVDEVEVSEVDIGGGRLIELTNVLVPQIKVRELVFSIEGLGQELNKENNKATLEMN